MTKRLAILLFALAGLATGIALAATGDTPLSGQGRHWTEGQALTIAATYTRAAPTLSNEGMSLVNVAGMRVQVCANQPNDGGTAALLGVGTLAAYYWDPYGDAGASSWHRNPTLDLTPSTAYLKCQTFPDVHTEVPYGRVLFGAAGLSNDGGVGVTITIDAKTVPK